MTLVKGSNLLSHALPVSPVGLAVFADSGRILGAEICTVARSIWASLAKR